MKKDVKQFNQICKDIKSIKIQGARNIAKAGLKAYNINKTKQAKAKLIKLRPTEPMLQHVLNLADKQPYEKIINHFNEAQEKINEQVLKLIKSKDVIFTHCHSTNVTHSLINAKKKKKNFEVYNTETRPLFQGRKTARELKKHNIKVTMFIDSALAVALEERQNTKKATKIFLGADALTKKGIINKIGSRTIAELAHLHKIPLYIIADSWKYSKKQLPIEQRKLNEVWDQAPKSIKIKNPAFDFVPKKYITKITTELGSLSYNKFLEKMN
jgi:translation initiation factor 2B subunit (eIF-2B alpha/beta/delta family)|tara:strand:- start:282 stop:1091 length:810 start_codon:yes stop_codon:yes gene_type:complete